MTSKSVPLNTVSSLGTVDLAEEIVLARSIFDRSESAVCVSEFWFGFDCEDIFVSEKYLGRMSDLETLKCIGR